MSRQYSYLKVNFDAVNQKEDEDDEHQDGVTAVENVGKEPLKNKNSK